MAAQDPILLGLSGATFLLTAESGGIIQSFSRNTDRKKIEVVDGSVGYTTGLVYWDPKATYNVRVITTASTGVPAASPGVALTLANTTTGNGVAAAASTPTPPRSRTAPASFKNSPSRRLKCPAWRNPPHTRASAHSDAHDQHGIQRRSVPGAHHLARRLHGRDAHSHQAGAAVTICIPAETPEKRQITFWFETKGEEFLGEKHEAATLDWAWRHKEEFEAAYPGHPFTHMRRGVDAFAWLLRVYHGDVQVAGDGGRADFRTQDIGMAAAFKALGERLVKFDAKTKEFFFRREVRGIVRDYENFRDERYMATPAALVRRALTVRAELVGLTKREDCVPFVRHTDGANPDDGCAVCDIPVGTPTEKVAEALEIFHSL